MNTGIIIQARLSSQRLPGKVLKPIFQNESILDIIIQRLKRLDLPIVIATGEIQKNNHLHTSALKNNVSFFSGSETDVLQRFLDCATAYKFDKILRVCADNPFLDCELAERIINISHSGVFDYVSYCCNRKPAILSHYGFFSEVISYNSLKIANFRTNSMFDREHVTPFIYRHANNFSIRLEQAPIEITSNENIRLTVDTDSDFDIAAKILEALAKKKGNLSYNYEDVLSVIKTMDESIKQNMAEQIRVNSKS